MEDIYLRYTSNPYKHFVSEEDYRNEIRPVVMRFRRCSRCKQYFTGDNPCVGLRVCMDCLLSKHPGMKFLKITAIDNDGEVTFAFIDEAGKVYISHENHSEDLTEDILHTLTQNGFPNVPHLHTPFKATEPVKLSASKFTLHGEVRSQSVVILDYSDTWEKHHFTFLIYKHGDYKELTKRGSGKVLFEKAVSLIEQTKQGAYYYVKGAKRSHVLDTDVFEIIAKMESAMYDLSLQFAPPQPEEELNPPTVAVEDATQEVSSQETNVQQEESTTQPLEETVEQVPADATEVVQEDRPKRGKRGNLTIVAPTSEGADEREHTTD